MTQGKI